MANSFQAHTANGSTANFSWAQIDGYLSTTHIKVYVNNIGPKTVTTEYTIDTTAKTITFTAGNIPSNGDYVEIRRVTPNTVAGLQVTFSDASVLTAADLNNAQKQNLFIAQEAYDTGDGGIALNDTGKAWDAQAKRIERVDVPVNLTDAATKQYVDSISLFGAYTVPQSWTASGNGITANFDLTNPVPSCTDPAMFLVEVNGVLQRPAVNYTIGQASGVYRIEFIGGVPGAGTNNIIIRNFGVARSALDVLPNSSVTAQYLATGAVETAKILDANVTAAKLATDSVTTDKIAANAVTDAKLATDSVTAAKIAADSVTAAKIAADSVTTAKILDANVTAAKIATGAIDGTKIANGSVSYAQLKATGFTSSGTGAYRMLHADASGNLNITNLTTALNANSISAFTAPTADFGFGNYKLTNLATPTASTDASTKGYVDSTRIGQVAVIMASGGSVVVQAVGTTTSGTFTIAAGGLATLASPAGQTWTGWVSGTNNFAAANVTNTGTSLTNNTGLATNSTVFIGVLVRTA